MQSSQVPIKEEEYNDSLTSSEQKKRKLEQEVSKPETQDASKPDVNPARARVFVGNLPLPHNMRPPEIFLQWFELAIQERATEAEKEKKVKSESDAVQKYTDGIECWSVDEGICFVRLMSKECAYAALRVNGCSYEGMPISVALPQCLPDPIYMGVPLVQLEPLPSPKPFLQKWRGKYVCFAELPANTSEFDIRALFEALGGPLESLWCHKEDGFFKGCGRLALVNSLIIESVVQRLNGAPVGSCILRIAALLPDNRRLPGINGIVPMMNFDGTEENIPPLSTSAQIYSDAVIALQMRAGKAMGSRPTRVVQLHNCIKMEDLLCEDLTNELIAEMRKEASKYGKLESVVAPRPIRKGTFHPDSGCGKVFLEYADTTSARKAQLEFNGRLFDNRVVCATFYPSIPFQLKQYSLLIP